MLATPRIAVFFQWFVVPDVRKVASLKRRVRRYLFSRQVKNGTPLWREARFQVKTHKTPQCRSHFWCCDVQKWHSAVARSTFAGENAQKLTVSEHFLKFWCRKITRRCGAKHICKSKCGKTDGYGPLLEVWCQKIARRCGAKHICRSKCAKHLRFAAFWEVSNWLA